MFTQCPECGVVLELQASNLRDAQAYVRCGQCGAVFNALDTLTDEASAPTDNLSRPDRELAPPLLEPERAESGPSDPEARSSYADLPGYDFDVEYVSDDDEFGEASLTPSVRIGEDEFFERDESPATRSAAPPAIPEPPLKTDAELSPAPGHSPAAPEETEAPDDLWQREAMQSLADLGLDDFPEARPVDSNALSQSGGFQNADRDDAVADASDHAELNEPAPVPAMLEREPEHEGSVKTTAFEVQEVAESSQQEEFRETDISTPGQDDPTTADIAAVAPDDVGTGPIPAQQADAADAHTLEVGHAADLSIADDPLPPEASDVPDNTGEPSQDESPAESPEFQTNPDEQQPDSEGEWNEVADWLVEFTGGQNESTSPAPLGDLEEPKPTAQVQSEPDHQDTAGLEPMGAEEQTAPPSAETETGRTAEGSTESNTEALTSDLNDEPESPTVEADVESDDGMQDWVLEEEVFEVMAELEPDLQSDNSADDGSYSLTDDIPGQESSPDLDPDSIVLAPTTPIDEERDEIERRPYDLSDESHLYESEDDEDWLTPKVAASVAEKEPASRVSTVAWVGAGTLLTLVLAAQIIYAVAPGAADASPVRQWARSLCSLAGCSVPLVKDTSKIVMINRSVRPHPGVEGTLLITAIFRNEAEHAQPFPIVEVTLSDLRGQRVGMRRFEPQEYLEAGNDIEQGMQPMTLVPVTLEVIEPESEAPDFLFDFY